MQQLRQLRLWIDAADVGQVAFMAAGTNQLTSLDGAPEKIGGTLYCSDNPVGYETLLAIYDLMKSGRSYTEALSQYWDQMTEEDKILMYGDNPDLSADEKRGYELRDKASSRIY
jgi:hypothetical protein